MDKLYIEKNITSSALLKKVLKEYGIDDEVVYNEYGKPYLKKREIYFNISDSYPYTVLVTSKKEVGIDIEKIRKVRDQVIRKVCNEDEQKLIKRPADFALMWAKKESYVKYLGVGLSYGLMKVDTTKIKNFVIKQVRNYYIAIYEGKEGE